jgi:hypothetical protein
MSEVRTNSITDAAGTGAPDFPNGIEVADGQNILIGIDSGDPFNANSRIRVQGTGDEWIQIKSDGTGTVGLLLGDTTDDFTAGIQSNQADGANLLFYAGNAVRMEIDSTGNVGIGTTTPNQLLDVNGTARITSLGVGVNSSGTTGEIRASNNITAYYSDDRLKTRIGVINDPIGKVMSLSGFYYEANETAQALGYEVKKEVGVSAQEVQAVMPEVVAPAPIDEQYMTVRYERLVPLLIEAIKAQQVQIDELRAKLGV